MQRWPAGWMAVCVYLSAVSYGPRQFVSASILNKLDSACCLQNLNVQYFTFSSLPVYKCETSVPISFTLNHISLQLFSGLVPQKRNQNPFKITRYPCIRLSKQLRPCISRTDRVIKLKLISNTEVYGL